MKEGSYVVIQSFMLTDLKLKGNELIVYATIYGFTQDGEHWFYGTKGYLAEWCGATKGTVGNCLKSLVEKGYVERRERVERGQAIVEYRATKNVGEGYKICEGGTQIFEDPQIDFVGNNNITEQPKDKAKDINASHKKAIESYTDDETLRDALFEFIRMRKLIRAPMTDRALSGMLAKLSKLSNSTEERVAILERSIENSWRGIFELPKGQVKDSGFDRSRYDYFS